MGQYLKGRKIGTCESMYYLRLAEAVELAERGAKDDDGIRFSTYLNDGVTRFRFPFPDEDDKDLKTVKFDKVFSLPCGGVEIGHDTICVHNEHQGGGHGVNIFIRCPHSKYFNLDVSSGGAGEQFIDVFMEGMRLKDGSTIEMEKKTIFKCSRCGKMQRLDDEQIKRVKARALEYYSVYDTTGKNSTYDGNQGLYDYAVKVINLIS